jgi:hypothetical protein
MSAIAQLKQRVLQAESERDFYKSLVDAFFTGDVPENADLNHMILAKWGRKRLEQLKKQPALLHTD